jgi:hypothetical protein
VLATRAMTSIVIKKALIIVTVHYLLIMKKTNPTVVKWQPTIEAIMIRRDRDRNKPRSGINNIEIERKEGNLKPGKMKKGIWRFLVKHSSTPFPVLT